MKTIEIKYKNYKGIIEYFNMLVIDEYNYIQEALNNFCWIQMIKRKDIIFVKQVND